MAYADVSTAQSLATSLDQAAGTVFNFSSPGATGDAYGFTTDQSPTATAALGNAQSNSEGGSIGGFSQTEILFGLGILAAGIGLFAYFKLRG